MKDGARAICRAGGRWVLIALALSARPPDRLTAVVQCPDGSPPPCRARPTRTTAGPAPNSLAVLYFDNLSRDTADAYLADGLTEAIIVRLGQIERLAVTSPNAVRRYRETATTDPAGLGRALRVAHLVHGTVRRAGNRLRVTVTLAKATTGVQLWGERYDRVDADLFAIEEDIARSVATAVSGRLLPAERTALAARATRHPEAYDRFLRGNYYLAQRTPRAVARAIEEYETGVRLDPAFTPALARAAYGYALYLDWGWAYPGAPAETLSARGFAAADRALATDSGATDGWMARAYLLAHQHPRTFVGVPEAFERAIALDPDNAEAWHQYGFILALQGKDLEAFAAFQRALMIDPERAITLHHIAVVHMTTRRLPEAARWLDSAVTIQPPSHYAYAARAFVRLRLGDTAGGRRDAEAAVALGREDPIWGDVALTIAQARAGDTLVARARAERIVGEMARADELTVDVGWLAADALVAVGEHERALELLERIRPRGAHLWFDLKWADLEPLRSHPRFQRLVEESRPR